MFKPAIVTTTIENFNCIRRFINYHNSIGFSKFFIFVDFYPYNIQRISGGLHTKDIVYSSASLYSQEETNRLRENRKELVHQLNQLPEVQAFLCDEEFHKIHYKQIVNLNERQRRNADYAAKLAYEQGCTHLAHLDYDELIYCKSSTFMSEIKKIHNAAYMQAWEAVVQHPNQKLFESTLFKKKLSTHQQAIMEENETTRRFKSAWFRGFKHYKTIYNLEYVIKNNINIGLHVPVQDIPYEERSKPDLNVLHFNCYNIDAFKFKWSHRIKHEPLWSYSLDQESKDECQSFLNCSTEEEIEKCYMGYYSLNENERQAMFKLDALVEININQHLFENTIPEAILRKRYTPKLKNSHLDLYPEIEDLIIAENVYIDPATCLVFNENFEPYKQTSLEYLWWAPPHFVTKDFKNVLTRPIPRELIQESTKKREAVLNEYINTIRNQEVVSLPDENYVSLLAQHGWYAFGHLFDFLQKIFTLKQHTLFDSDTHYLVSNYERINDFSLYLDIMSESSNVRHTMLKSDKRLRFAKKCVLIKPQTWPQNFANVESYEFIYNSFCKYFNNHIPKEQKNSKLFLTRNFPVKRNILNFAELHEQLQKHDISVLYGNEPISDMFYYFNNATHVCGYHGSLFANHIFCKPGTKILEYCAANRPDGSISDKWRHTELYYQKYVEADSKYDAILPIQEIIHFYYNN